MAKVMPIRKLAATLKAQRSHRSESRAFHYENFNQIDGTHPWQSKIPEATVMYQVRQVTDAKIAYFNYELAKDMGLIDKNHPHKMNKALEAKLLSTFAIRIINEYDVKTKRSIDTSLIKPNRYMATRYLQLQHSNKQGRTSGDGRSIWNGVVRYKDKVWDVSSRGTGVTCLAPGAVAAGKPLKTGSTEFGYGCGTADIDELYGAAMMSEIYHNQGLKTERVLCIVDLGKNLGIGVRAAPNLLRPAHLFAFLKQSNLAALRRGLDVFIQRQHQNREWIIVPSSKNRYSLLMPKVAKTFAQFAARLESDYIFLWLDWDGDNVLANGGIIDYGSVRQFGLRHDEYRYDDVDRFSTNLNEQKRKARETVQTFAQLCDYAKSGRKRPFGTYKKSKFLKIFDQEFDRYLMDLFLLRMGFTPKQAELLERKQNKALKKFVKIFKFFETKKTNRKTQKLADGVNRPAIFNMREVLRELPSIYVKSGFRPIPHEQLFHIMLASSATGRDTKLHHSLVPKIKSFQRLYMELIQSIDDRHLNEVLNTLNDRAQVINRADRITGNSVEWAVSAILSATQRGLPMEEVQKVIDTFILKQSVDADQKKKRKHLTLLSDPRTRKLIDKTFKTILNYREDI